MTVDVRTGRTEPVSGRRTARTKRAGGLGDIALVLPATVIVVVLLYIPFVYTAVLSFFSYSGIGPAKFVGLSNYRTFFSSGDLTGILRNTLLWVGGTLVLPVGLGLLAAVLTSGMRGSSAVRLILLVPYGMSGAAVGVLWGFILEPNGALNDALRSLHLPGGHTSFLAHAPLNTILMVFASTWQGIGVNLLLFAVGLRSIPQDAVEAARIDGAGGWRMFRYITWPLLRPITVIVVGLAIVNGLKTFDIVWILTQGGPGLSSATLAVDMYQRTFGSQEYGAGAAAAVLLTIVAAAASLLYLRRQLSSGGGT